MTASSRQLAELIVEIEQEMRRIALWSERAPSAEALASSMPFCYDTLEMSEWLQWVFLPRVEQMLLQGERFPGRCDIASLAEVWFSERQLSTEAAQLLDLIRQFDRALSSTAG